MSNDKINIKISGGTASFENVIQGNSNLINKDKSDSSDNSITDCKIFISYRRSDSSNISGRIYDLLTEKLGEENVFKDVYSIPAGKNFKKFIENEISKADVLLAIIGKNWTGNSGSKSNSRIFDSKDFIRLEIKTAINREKPIIPIFISGATMPNENEIPSDIEDIIFINGINMRKDPDFKNDFNYLLKSIKNICC